MNTIYAFVNFDHFMVLARPAARIIHATNRNFPVIIGPKRTGHRSIVMSTAHPRSTVTRFLFFCHGEGTIPVTRQSSVLQSGYARGKQRVILVSMPISRQAERAYSASF